MKTKIILFALFIVGIISCSNQPAEKLPVETQKNIPNIDSTTFTIVTKQDTTTQNGESIIRYDNGAVKMQGKMKEGKREGLWKSFYENGKQWSESTFTAGIKNGKTATWYENGNKRYEGFYSNDLESGKWTYWDETGKLVNSKDFGKK